MFDNLMKMRIMMVLPVAATLVLAGCEEQDMATAPAPEKVDLSQTEDMFTAPVKPNPLTTDPSTVIVRVNGEDITLGDVNDMMAMALQHYGNQIPPEQLQSIKGRMFDQIKEQLINEKLINGAIAAANISVDEADVSNAVENIKTSLPTNLTLQAALEQEGQTMNTLLENIRTDMARRKLLESKTADVAEATEAEAKEFYDANPDQFVKPENVTASHILIKVEPSDTDEVKAEKKAKLEKIRASIIAGDISFEDAAKQDSDCPSAAQGGSLGTFGKGRMVPEFEVAAFAQEVGEVGDVIETQFGYHIIKVTDHQEESSVSFEDTKDRLIQYLTNQKKQKAAMDYMASLRDSAKIEEM